MKRAVGGRFATTCDSKIHEANQPHAYLISLASGKRISKKNYDILIATNELNENPRNICKKCMDKLLEQPSVTSHTQNVTEEQKNDDYAEFLSQKAIQLAKELYPLLVSDIGYLKKGKFSTVKKFFIN